MLIQAALILSAACLLHGTVLDPAMFLAPAPPLALTRSDLTPEQRWTQPPASPHRADPIREQRWTQPPASPHRADPTREQRWTPDAGLDVVPLAKKADIEEGMEGAETFWPVFSSRAYSKPTPTFKIPMTFAVSGTYGGYNAKPGLIGSTYMSSSLAGAGSSRLAGTGYSDPGLGSRVYGGTSGSWTGWGNGRWGHYGRG